MSAPLFPKLIPSALDPLWFTVDKPCDDENELSELEEEHQSWLESISKKDYNITPIGKSSEQYDDEDDDDDDEGDDDDDESDTNDDELDTDMIDDRDSPEEVDMDAGGLAVT
ncbi:hypothetical protein ACJMK2_032803 [Sinanodonta woodiana]|uniref:Anaphase-promoting complex subunit 15 n=1 Tax=Sinanodonta woodiana TaxID=1069815 RepID=A0ABD3X3G8_SINWO